MPISPALWSHMVTCPGDSKWVRLKTRYWWYWYHNLPLKWPFGSTLKVAPVLHLRGYSTRNVMCKQQIGAGVHSNIE